MFLRPPTSHSSKLSKVLDLPSGTPGTFASKPTVELDQKVPAAQKSLTSRRMPVAEVRVCGLLWFSHTEFLIAVISLVVSSSP